MSIIDYFLIAGYSISFILLVLFISFLVYFIYNLSRKNKLSKQITETKRNRKQLKRAVKKLQETNKSILKKGFVSLIIGVLIFGGTLYLKFYQSTTLTTEDTDRIVYGYYLIEQLEEQFQLIEEGDIKKSTENIRNLSMPLASYYAKKGDERGTEEAQLLLNSYYSRIGQLGVNISGEDVSKLVEDSEKQEEYLIDIEDAKKIQKSVIKFYKIDEKSLKSKN